jgi:hypothetical protein
VGFQDCTGTWATGGDVRRGLAHRGPAAVSNPRTRIRLRRPSTQPRRGRRDLIGVHVPGRSHLPLLGKLADDRLGDDRAATGREHRTIAMPGSEAPDNDASHASVGDGRLYGRTWFWRIAGLSSRRCRDVHSRLRGYSPPSQSRRGCGLLIRRRFAAFNVVIEFWFGCAASRCRWACAYSSKPRSFRKSRFDWPTSIRCPSGSCR